MKSAIEENSKANGKRILSNKRKPLFLRASILENSFRNMWRFEICQANAKGIIIDKYSSFFSLSDISSELLLLFSLMTNQYLAEIHNQESKNEIDALKLSQKSFEDSILSLDMDSLLSLHLRIFSLTAFEKRQIEYTFQKAKTLFDPYVNRIDDGEQRRKVEENNASANKILEYIKKYFPKLYAKFLKSSK